MAQPHRRSGEHIPPVYGIAIGDYSGRRSARNDCGGKQSRARETPNQINWEVSKTIGEVEVGYRRLSCGATTLRRLRAKEAPRRQGNRCQATHRVRECRASLRQREPTGQFQHQCRYRASRFAWNSAYCLTHDGTVSPRSLCGREIVHRSRTCPITPFTAPRRGSLQLVGMRYLRGYSVPDGSRGPTMTSCRIAASDNST